MGERLFIDISGPYPKTNKGNKYWIKIVDDYSRFSYRKFMESKSDIIKEVPKYIQKMNAKGNKVRFIRCDNAGENVNQLKEDCENKFGIDFEVTPPKTPQMNGVVERRFVTDRLRARAMILAANLNDKLEKTLWAEAVSCAEQIGNLTASEKISLSQNTKYFMERNQD